ncbi:hypothetical protein BDV98DRAFT_497138 [Pterulicium gracile]|uniref:BTB domain-containing protein n=1 Tax=Pterulicium gracile TaxID=1884261 RepID=A0A5C3R0J6_9AGAR|nr:hypothetical protein BDV98DRAFT_497138 [Pterula gracilis]
MNPHVKRHRQFYIRTGNLHFLVGRYLFRVHQHFFTAESEYFRDLLETTVPGGYTAKGMDDANAIILDDVLVEEFECFLAVFYEPYYTLDSPDEWLLILELASHWRFGEVKKTAVRALNKLGVPEVDRIVAFQNHGVSNSYILPLLAAVVAREEPLTAEEGEKLGMRTAIHIAQLRETARSNTRRARGEPALEDRRVDANVQGIVQETFNIPTSAPT